MTGLPYEATPTAIVFTGTPSRHLMAIRDAILELGYAGRRPAAHRLAASFFHNPAASDEAGAQEAEAALRRLLEEHLDLRPLALAHSLELLPPLSEQHQRAIMEAFREVHSALGRAASALAEAGLELEMRFDSRRGYLIALARPFQEEPP